MISVPCGTARLRPSLNVPSDRFASPAMLLPLAVQRNFAARTFDALSGGGSGAPATTGTGFAASPSLTDPVTGGRLLSKTAPGWGVQAMTNAARTIVASLFIGPRSPESILDRGYRGRGLRAVLRFAIFPSWRTPTNRPGPTVDGGGRFASGM